jgi:N utilization substance protein B
MHNQRKLRIAAIQALFQFDVQGDAFADKTEEFLRTQELSDKDIARTNDLIACVRARMTETDGLIDGASEHWDLRRITPIDRAILRLAICELLFIDATPPKVAINEAIELAKTFGEAESPHFVNGLLDAIWKKSQ